MTQRDVRDTGREAAWQGQAREWHEIYSWHPGRKQLDRRQLRSCRATQTAFDSLVRDGWVEPIRGWICLHVQSRRRDVTRLHS
eukprot:3213672-Pyramimonas_sp.AAC.1